MKIFTFLFFCLTILKIQSQVFTNASVFDYNIGDTLVMMDQQISSTWPAGGPPLFRYRIFTGKSVTTNPATIFYNYNEIQKQVVVAAPPQFSFTSGTMTITNLNAPLATTSLIPVANCQKQKTDTTLIDCNLNQFRRYLTNNGCPEVYGTKMQTYIEGAGSFFEYRSGQESLTVSGFLNTFVKIHKVGSPCGVVGYIATGLNTVNQTRFSIYPQPVSSHLNITTEQPATYSLIGADGQFLSKGDLSVGKNAIPVFNYGPGVYVVMVEAGHENFRMKFVKE